jgi:hypothetical protein
LLAVAPALIVAHTDQFALDVSNGLDAAYSYDFATHFGLKRR